MNPGALQAETAFSRTLPRALALVAALAFCYWGLLRGLYGSWLSHAVYSHGVLIPFISAYLVWHRKDLLLSMSPRPSFLAGAGLLVFALLLHLFGFLGGILLFQEVSLICALAGAVLLVLGRGFLAVLAFPIAYLLFMLTSWDMFTARLHFPFQLFSAGMGAGILELAGIPVFRSSVYIELPNITLHVAEVCSGVNYLISVAAVGIPLSYIALRSWIRRLALVAGALAIAVLANGLRVALIGVLSFYDIAGDLHGPYHVLHAMFVSVFGYAVLFIGAWLLSEPGTRRQPTPRIQDIKFFMPARPVAAAVFLFASAGLFVNFHAGSPVPPRSDLSVLTESLQGWEVAGEVHGVKTGGPDRELSKRFRDGTGRESAIYIAYYDFQEQGRELVGSGSDKLHRKAEEITLRTALGERKVSRTTAEFGGVETEMIFWYGINGRTVSGRLAAKGYTVLDSIFGRTNGAMVVVWGEGMEDLASEAIPLVETGL